MVVQAARGVARGPVARLVAAGARNTHDWTPEKGALLPAFDESGLTSLFVDPELGGYLDGPKNLALALVAFELAWVDAGAATCSLAGVLALEPIHERGTKTQRDHYMRQAVPPAPGETRELKRGAFCLTEPIPYVGVETGLLGGKVRVAEWPEGGTPRLQVDKRGRFITNMAFANFVTAAVESADDRIKGTCMVILEETDPGTFDRGVPTRKLVHQLSSTRDPAFSLTVPADRIIGGYTVKDGVIVPNYSHCEMIEAVFRRTRVTVGLMTSAKLLSAVEPVIRYQRGRFRGGDSVTPGSVRYELGLQQRQDTLHRLVDVWAAGEASASLGFTAARVFDELDPLERQKDAYFAEKGLSGRAQLKALVDVNRDALEYLKLTRRPGAARDEARIAELEANELVRFVLLDSVANVLCPACKLWNTGHGATMMREAVSLMGGYGITEDCPGFLGHKWMDAQLEATYEGPEAVQRRQLSVTMTHELFLAQFRQWIAEMRRIADRHPGTGACTLASAMQLWLWTLELPADGRPTPTAASCTRGRGRASPSRWPTRSAGCSRRATRCSTCSSSPKRARPTPPWPTRCRASWASSPTSATCRRRAPPARWAASCAELVFGYRRHPAWDEDGCRTCHQADELEALEEFIPGIAGTARALGDVIEADGSHPAKAGPCARTDGLEPFLRMRAKMDGCLTGARLAKDRAAENLTKVMIPEALGYPV